jgi:hypothetical protein
VITIGAELQIAAVVVIVGRIRDAQDGLDGVGVDGRGAGRGIGESYDDVAAAVGVGEVYVERAVGRVAGMKRETKQPLLSRKQNQILDVQERCRQHFGAVKYFDAARLFDGEQPARAVTGEGDASDVAQVVGDQLEVERWWRGIRCRD